MRRLCESDDTGSFAILYALILLLFIGFAALILDLGALRAERRAAQSTSDFASTAGAMTLLSDFGGSPEQACREALRFVDANIADNRFSLTESEIQAFCSDEYPDTDSACYAADLTAADDPTLEPEDVYPEISRELLQDAYVVTLTWPVDIDETDYANGYSTDVDGHRCERFSVQVDVTHGFVLGRGLGWLDEGQTGAPATARAQRVKRDDIVAALVVLDLHGCWSLRGGGNPGSAFHVFESELEDDDDTGIGVIAIDSDGTGSNCSTNNRTMRLDGNNTAILAGIVDDGTGDPAIHPSGEILVRKGAIFSYALSPDGNANHAYDPADVAAKRLAGGDSSPPLPGNPPVRPPEDERVERQRWYHRYDCRDSYADDRYDVHAHEEIERCEGREDDDGNVVVEPNSRYISEFRGRIQAIDDDANTQQAAEDAGFTYVTGTPRCDLDAFESGTVTGDWWFDCDLDVGAGDDVSIDGNAVVMGDLDLGGGRFAMRTAMNGQDGWLYVDGEIDKTAGASLALGSHCDDTSGDNCDGIADNDAGGVAVIMSQGPDNSDGRINMRGGAGEELTWVAPYRPDVVLDGDRYNFEDLGLWTEYTLLDNQPLIIGGDVNNLVVDGIFFMPNAWFSFRGSGEMGQQRAQFIAYRADVRGGGALRMRPDPSRAEPLFSRAITLIR